jgi:hypothetical protein
VSRENQPAPRPMRKASARQLAALLLIAALTPAANAEDALGRLFFTPERRQALDRQRQLNIPDSQQADEDPTLTINGMVTRSSGKRTAWVNGAPQNENEMRGGWSVSPLGRNGGRIVVKSAESPSAHARIGDTINRTTGEASSLLKDGQIRVIPRPSAGR